MNTYGAFGGVDGTLKLSASAELLLGTSAGSTSTAGATVVVATASELVIGSDCELSTVDSCGSAMVAPNARVMFGDRKRKWSVAR